MRQLLHALQRLLPSKPATEEGDPEIVRALLGEPASSRPSVPHADAVPASTKKDEWL